MKLHLDVETRSAVDLRKVGAYAYAEHPSTEIMCFTFGTDKERLQSFSAPDFGWDWRKLVIPGFDKDFIVGHNVAFEYAVYNLILHKRFGWPERWSPALWGCTMSRSAMCGLPLDLDGLGRVLQIKTPKDLDGRRIMLQLSKPTGIDALGEAVFDEDPQKMKRLLAYNRVDVLADIEIDALLPELPPHERAIWEQDLLINRRGVQVDVELAKRAASLAGSLTTDLNEQLRSLTGGAVDKATQVSSMKMYLKSKGVDIPVKIASGPDAEDKESLDKASIVEILSRKDLPPVVRKVINIRRQVGKSSTAKYTKMIETACKDGRVRGALQYHAAHTGRFGGRLIQPQNYPKGFNEEDQALAISLINGGDPEVFSFTYGERGMDALSDALRGTIIAGPGKVLVAADFNAIEARVLFWLAGDVFALTTYRQGGSPYLDMGAFIYRKPISKKDAKEYAVAKMTVLGAGFGMGHERFRDQCLAYGIDVTEELAKTAIQSYREKYSSVVRMWGEMEHAAISAVKNPQQRFPAGKTVWGMSADRRFLCCKLPSGRYLWYWKPSVRLGKTPWGEEKEEMTYWGEHPKTREWAQLKTYGGSLVENVVQAVARDLMANGMQKVEAVGYNVILTCHDELIGEHGPTDEKGRLKEVGQMTGELLLLKNFIHLMCQLPSWASDCPVAAEGFVAPRYRK